MPQQTENYLFEFSVHPDQNYTNQYTVLIAQSKNQLLVTNTFRIQSIIPQFEERVLTKSQLQYPLLFNTQ